MPSWKKVKANKGSHGIDEESIEEFEAKLKDNLYKLWSSFKNCLVHSSTYSGNLQKRKPSI